MKLRRGSELRKKIKIVNPIKKKTDFGNNEFLQEIIFQNEGNYTENRIHLSLHNEIMREFDWEIKFQLSFYFQLHFSSFN